MVIKLLVTHTLKPFYDKNSKVLILGSIPSVKSRELGFYYAHKRNRFWSTLSKIYGEQELETIDDKKLFLKKHHIALYDVIYKCEIEASSDTTIKNPIPVDLSIILNEANIKVIFTTGKKAYELYQKFLAKKTNIKVISLPSTSPANAKKGIEDLLLKEYSKIKDYTN